MIVISKKGRIPSVNKDKIKQFLDPIVNYKRIINKTVTELDNTVQKLMDDDSIQNKLS